MRKASSSKPAARIPNGMFWGLVIVMWVLSQAPYIRVPIGFLGTWIHELGHGLGALLSGGTFEKMILSPDLSGMAYSAVSGSGAHVLVILSGLLAPSLFGALLLILTRGLNKSRTALWGLSAGLILSGIIWAGDLFTGASIIGIGAVLALFTWKAPEILRRVGAQILAISFCLNAVTHMDYFFMKSGFSGGQPVHSDTASLSNITGVPHIFLAILVSFISLGCLYLAVKISGRFSKTSAPQ